MNGLRNKYFSLDIVFYKYSVLEADHAIKCSQK